MYREGGLTVIDSWPLRFSAALRPGAAVLRRRVHFLHLELGGGGV